MTTNKDGLVGVLERPTFQIQVWKLGAPQQNGATPDGDYLYLTKIHSNGQIGERSIGLPASDLPELLKILNRLSKGN